MKLHEHIRTKPELFTIGHYYFLTKEYFSSGHKANFSTRIAMLHFDCESVEELRRNLGIRHFEQLEMREFIAEELGRTIWTTEHLAAWALQVEWWQIRLLDHHECWPMFSRDGSMLSESIERAESNDESMDLRFSVIRVLDAWIRWVEEGSPYLAIDKIN